jgi:hypothetical protein
VLPQQLLLLPVQVAMVSKDAPCTLQAAQRAAAAPLAKWCQVSAAVVLFVPLPLRCPMSAPVQGFD